MFLYILLCACAVATTSFVTKLRHRTVLRCAFCSIILCCFGVAAFSVCETATVIIRSISLNDIMNFAHRFSSYIYECIPTRQILLDEWTLIAIGSASVLSSLFVYWLSRGLLCVGNVLSSFVRWRCSVDSSSSANKCGLPRNVRRRMQLRARRVESKRIRRLAKLARESRRVSSVIFRYMLLYVLVSCRAMQAFIPILACAFLWTSLRIGCVVARACFWCSTILTWVLLLVLVFDFVRRSERGSNFSNAEGSIVCASRRDNHRLSRLTCDDIMLDGLQSRCISLRRLFQSLCGLLLQYLAFVQPLRLGARAHATLSGDLIRSCLWPRNPSGRASKTFQLSTLQ